MIPQKSLYKIKNLSGNVSRYPTISHKTCFVPNVDVLDFVGDFFGGIQKVGQHANRKLLHGKPLRLRIAQCSQAKPSRFEQWGAPACDDSWNDQHPEHQNQLCEDALPTVRNPHPVPHTVLGCWDSHAVRHVCVSPPSGSKEPRPQFMDAQTEREACHNPTSCSNAILWRISHRLSPCCTL